MRVRDLFTLLLLFTSACGPRQLDDGGEDLGVMDGVDSPTQMPDWSPCRAEGEVETCADACGAEGLTCVANGCPVDPDYCAPGNCSMATQALTLDTSVFCTDVSVGVFMAATCEEPIHWLFSNTVRCCCAQDD
jgi:hypothetical protein